MELMSMIYEKRGAVVPAVIEKTPKGERTWDIYSRLLKDRIVFVTDEIETNMANLIVSQLLYLDSENNEPIMLYVNSPGGMVTAGMAIIDTMHTINSPVYTVCIGMCASMGAYILSQGDKRYILPNAEVMIHQPLGGANGQATDIEIAAKNILKTKAKLTKGLALACNQPYEKVKEDCERDYWMDSDEALAYGIVDEIMPIKIKKLDK